MPREETELMKAHLVDFSAINREKSKAKGELCIEGRKGEFEVMHTW